MGGREAGLFHASGDRWRGRLAIPHSGIVGVLASVSSGWGCPVLVNTSFNVRGEPIVRTPADAFRCFMGTGLDCLAIGHCFLRQEEQDPSLEVEGHEDSFEPD